MSLFKYINFAFKVLKANLKRLDHPYKIFLVVTKSCDSRCNHCLIWKEIPENEMTLSEYKDLAMNLGPNLSWLNLSGGEPTNREDLIAIIQTFIDHCPNLLIVNFTSNGLNPERLKEVAAFLSHSSIPIKGINISIDGTEELHDKIRGMKGSYQKAIEAYKILRTFKRLKAHASMTLVEKNSHYIEATYAELKKRIPDFSKEEFHLNYSFSSEHYYQNKVLLNSLSPEFDFIEFSHKDFYSRFSPTLLLKKIYWRKLSEYLHQRKSPLPCSALSSNLYISEKGGLYPCTIWNKEVGSLRENSFDLLYLMKSPKAMSLKQQVVLKQCPNCWSPCEAFPSILDNLNEAIK